MFNAKDAIYDYVRLVIICKPQKQKSLTSQVEGGGRLQLHVRHPLMSVPSTDCTYPGGQVQVGHGGF